MIEMINELERIIAPLKKKLIDHPLYKKIKTVDDLKLFNSYHIYAVWDFMSLVKKLQLEFTCTELPWRPPSHPEVGRLINEIVWGEETDLDFSGRPMSHFEMYLEAMKAIKVDTTLFNSNYQRLISSPDILSEIEILDLPSAVKDFLKFTFETINSNKIHCIAAVFTFGREDLIPDLFIEIIKNLEQKDNTNIQPMVYYFERHIEVDGDEHGPLALKMVELLCENDKQKWEEATEAAKIALEKRLELWDSISSQISLKTPVY
jgi:hypothetical protein